MAAVRAHITPELLRWARKQANYDPEVVMKAAGIKSLAKYEAFEAGTERPTIKQLWKIADKLKRPVSFFYLPKAPDAPEPLRDFRRLSGIVAGMLSPQLALQISRAREAREIALSLYSDVDEEPPVFFLNASVNDDPEDVAQRIRAEIGADIDAQRRITIANQIFNYWRGLLEGAGVLVLQARGVKLEEMRGFCLSERPLPVVVANVKDWSYRGRAFTVLHELAHVVIGESGISDTQLEVERPPEEQKVEVFCNHVAGAVLVPFDSLRSHPLVLARGREFWSQEDISKLANQFAASREVTVRRLMIHGYVSEQLYEHMREQYIEEYERTTAQRKEKKSIVTEARKKTAYNGTLLTRLALTSYYNERITSVELSRILDVKLKHMSKIERAVMGSNLMFTGG